MPLTRPLSISTKSGQRCAATEALGTEPAGPTVKPRAPDEVQHGSAGTTGQLHSPDSPQPPTRPVISSLVQDLDDQEPDTPSPPVVTLPLPSIQAPRTVAELISVRFLLLASLVSRSAEEGPCVANTPALLRTSTTVFFDAALMHVPSRCSLEVLLRIAAMRPHTCWSLEQQRSFGVSCYHLLSC